MKRLTLILLPFILLWVVLTGYGLYGLLKKKTQMVMASEGLQHWQDEQIHQSVSREVMLELSQTTGSPALAEAVTLAIGYAKEWLDVAQGKPYSERDIEANMQGCADARQRLGVMESI